MKTKLIYILTACMVSLHAVAQDVRTIDTKVADILAQMPTDDLPHRNRLMNEMVSLGKDGLSLFAGKVIPPGTGDDTAVRFALNGLVRYLSHDNSQEAVTLVEQVFLQALDGAKDKEVKAFFIHQLKLIGGEPSVLAAAEYLQDDRLGQAAVQLIVAIGGAKAEQALLAALPSASGANQVAVVKGLGTLQVSAAVAAITPLVGGANADLQRAALYTLANIADASSMGTLLGTAKAVKYTYEPTNAVGALTHYADRLGQKQQLDAVEKVCKNLIKNSKTTEQLHIKATGLSILAKYFGHEVTDQLIKAVDNPHKPFRHALLGKAEPMGGIADTKAWIARAKQLSSTVQSEIILMLGRRGDSYAVPYLQQSLSASAVEVRQAAATALVKLKGREALPHLLAQAKRTTNENEMAHLQEQMLMLTDKEHLAPFVALLGSTQSRMQQLGVDVIAAKSGSQYFSDVLSLTGASDNGVKAAAYKALPRVAKQDDVKALLTLLYQTNDQQQIGDVQKAIVSAVSSIEESNKQTAPLLKTMESAGEKERIVKILPRLGGSNALKAVQQLFNTGSAKEKEVAFDALVNWSSHDASQVLYQICKTDKGNYKTKAFDGFVKQIAKSNLPAEQKLLHFQNIMPYASTHAQRNAVIKSLSSVKTFLSFVYVSEFLDDKALQQQAAESAMRIALPPNGRKVGLYGDLVRAGLEKAASIISGPESQYYKIDIENYLKTMPTDQGFVSMFNGKDLSGWQGLVGNPISRAKMSKRELARKQKEANAKMGENWSVKDGMIVFSGKGQNLCSIKEYGDFEMLVDWRISKNGDSGIYLRGTPQVQIWDTSRTDVGAQVGSGGLYNNNPHRSTPLKVTDNPIGEWNTFRIVMIGEKVTVYSNGELVVDNVTMDNYWDRKQPIFPKGPIELQAHGTDLAFRNIYVREIKAGEYNLSEDEKAEGFTALFNGSNLDGWQGNKTDYVVEDGEIVIRPKRGGHGNLFTEKEYSDFNFRFEFKLTPGANNGLGIRAPLQGDAAYQGMELQILDNTAPIYANLAEYQYHGSVYGVIPAKRGYLKPVGEWNSEEVIVKGSKIKVILNGKVIVDGDIHEASKNGTLDKKNHPGLQRTKGYIGFLGHGSVVYFRNIRIKDLTE